MEVKVGRTYVTKSGLKVLILTDKCRLADGSNVYNVTGLVHEEDGCIRTASFTKDGSKDCKLPSHMDLVAEWSPYLKLIINEPVRYTRYSGDTSNFIGHFAGIQDGVPQVWANGRTSFTETAKFGCQYLESYSVEK